MGKEYIFGYGSLISTEARHATGLSSRSWPARVRGLQRYWNACAQHYSVLGVTKNETSSCNGLVIEIPEEDLPKFDLREEAYRREVVPSGSISYLEQEPLEELAVWVYIPHETHTPTSSKPIIQSYVDVALAGCLEQNESFAREFISQTQGWDEFWIDDRREELYVRALQAGADYQLIDRLLGELARKG